MDLDQNLDAVRSRWQAWHEGEGLGNPRGEGFANGSLAHLMPGPQSRFVALSTDPQAHLVEFDEDFWSWWGVEFDDPASDGETRWGGNKLPTADAAVFGDRWTDTEWARYIAVHRNGALEVGLGRDARLEHNERQYFPLTQIVGRCWAALSRFSSIVERYEPDAPFEVTLALAQTEGGLLANVAEGWAEPGQGFGNDQTCPLANVLIQRELPEWSADESDLQALAFSIGAQIEDTWGYTERRFIARAGDNQGEFDRSRISWHL